jgi:flagellar M-ring protein FliF
VQWGSAVPVSTAASRTVVPGVGTTAQGTAQNAVGGTTTTVATPPGAVVRQTVSVAVDRARLGRTSVTALRRLVASAVGLVPARGDRLSLVVTRFATPVAVPAPQPSLLAVLLPDAVPAIWGAGGVLAVLLLAGAARGRKARARA